ncbi:uncharacterized protein LOC131638661 [Vicia villosa]|uniref:uncharacterized protein LOC131638661 n=1 Tax=Vicia villosa TaxID=3911 RepID=UPI00273BF21C|nr:uncharacterized protein LOC131638661 [Vicia villosa]
MYKFSTDIAISDHESLHTMKGNKPPTKLVSDSISMDSLSFSGLVSIQDQQKNLHSPPTNQAKQFLVSKHDQEFEFTNPKVNLNSPVNPIKITPADQLISNGQLQLQPQAFAFQTTQNLIVTPTSSSRSLLAAHSGSEMASGKTGSSMKYHELGKESKHTNKPNTKKRTGFCQRMKSFLSPCRECRTAKQGAVKAHTVQRENLKIY